ncbi:MAG: hypothetical protein ACRDZN_16915, partial [Acidimicrobiales bacterium]
MITVQGSIPFPPNTNSAPIKVLAGNLQRLSAGLLDGSTKVGDLVGAATTAWVGAAADAFTQHMTERSAAMTAVAQQLAKAAAVLDAFAVAIDTNTAAYTTFAIAEIAARGGLPWTAEVVGSLMLSETKALGAHQVAGAACAGALGTIAGTIAAVQLKDRLGGGERGGAGGSAGQPPATGGSTDEAAPTGGGTEPNSPAPAPPTPPAAPPAAAPPFAVPRPGTG